MIYKHIYIHIHTKTDRQTHTHLLRFNSLLYISRKKIYIINVINILDPYSQIDSLYLLIPDFLMKDRKPSNCLILNAYLAAKILSLAKQLFWQFSNWHGGSSLLMLANAQKQSGVKPRQYFDGRPLGNHKTVS